MQLLVLGLFLFLNPPVFAVSSTHEQNPAKQEKSPEEEKSAQEKKSPEQEQPAEQEEKSAEEEKSSEQEKSAEEEKSPEQEKSAQEEKPAQEGQTPEQAKTPSQETPQPESPASAGLGFRFNNVPIRTLIDTVMQELGYTYIIAPQVQGTVSIYTMKEIPKQRAFAVLEQLLQMNGQAIVKQDGMYVIVPLGQSTKIPHGLVVKPEAPSQEQQEQEEEQETEPAAQEPPSAEPNPPQPQSAGQPAQEAPTEAEPVVSTLSRPESQSEEEGVITYIIPLHYVPSGEMVTMITPFVSDGANIINYASANMIFVTDYLENIEQVLKLVNLLDTQYFDVNTVDLIPIHYNQAVDIANDLAQVFAPGGTAGVRIVAIERLNSILVVTRSPSVFQEVKKWVDKLDAPTAGTNIKTFVYQVENNTAQNIADVLGQLYQDGFGLPSAPTEEIQEGQPQQPITPPREAGFVSPVQQGFQQQIGQQLGPSLVGRPMSTQSGIRAVVAANIKIIVNEFNNSLIIQATEADYQFLLQTIKQLDVLPRQVWIEAKIYSVELRDDLSFGVAAFLEKRGANGDDMGGPATTAQISPEGTLSVATRAFIGRARQLEAVINTLRSRTDVEIVEAPRLLAIDGMQASINVGAEVPVTTASFGDPLRAGTATAFVNAIQFRPTGTTLLIMPRISASGIVTMDLAIEVSSASGAALTPTINRNFITTSLIVRDGQTVAIAGIISDQADFARNRVPLLGDIPILGALFGQTTRTRRRAELIFFITPYVIRNLPTATELTLEFRRALRKAYDFIREKEAEESELIQERREKELRNR